MLDSHIAKVYAKALLEIGAEKNNADILEEELRETAGSLSSDKDIWGFLISPRVSKKQKAETLEKAFQGKVSETVVSFLLLLVRNDRPQFLPEISLRYRDFNDARKKLLRAKVSSAVKLGDPELKEIRTWLMGLGYSDCVLENTVDSELIGGIVIQYGDKRIDGSMKKQLEKLKHGILNNDNLLSKDKIGTYYEN